MNVLQVIRRDTQAWISQVWISFVLALALTIGGVARLPSEGLVRALLATAFLFCLSAAFTLAKALRDNRDRQVDTSAWMVQVWASFVISHVVAVWNLARVEISFCEKTYLVVSWLFLMSATFTVSKTVRDNHEAAQSEAALEESAEMPSGAR